MAIQTQSIEDFKRSAKIEIANPGIKNTLKKFSAYQALAEFIWNGFDAGATVVDVQFEQNEIGYVSELRVVDNGSGIELEQLDKKFTPFLHSNKPVDPATTQHSPSSVHGKNGIGRLTFFKFATSAEWSTIYQNRVGKLKKYKIRVDAERLNFHKSNDEIDVDDATGTSVRFLNIFGLFESGLEGLGEYLVSEFAWLLELNAPKRTILVNGMPICHESLVADRGDFEKEIQGVTFAVRFVRWSDNLHREYSRYYFIDSNDKEKWKRTTSLNNKGDSFYHSVYVKSKHFDSFNFSNLPGEDEAGQDQTSLDFTEIKKDDVFKELMSHLDLYLRQKRRPFLKKKSKLFVSSLEKDKAFPPFTADPWDQLRKSQLQDVMREIYEVEPRIFNGLSKQQTQTMVQLFSLAMDSSERNNLLEVIAQVVSLDAKDRSDLAEILKTTHLSHVISTIKLIEDRLKAIDELKEMVFCEEFGANEKDHLQTHIERHYWIFGEQYHLVTAEEPKFDEALRKYTVYLTGVETGEKVDHEDKYREMDIFAVRVMHELDQINNIVVELKHPKITLGEKELRQVKKYLSVIFSEPMFNASNRTWDFYLVGKDFDGYIVGEMDSNKNHGEKHLVYKRSSPNYRIFDLRWSEIFANFEIKHKYLLEKLKMERDKISTPNNHADDILVEGQHNSALMPGAIQ